MKIDLHVHSKYSTRPSHWVLQKLGCHECYTEPLALYRIAKEREVPGRHHRPQHHRRLPGNRPSAGYLYQ